MFAFCGCNLHSSGFLCLNFLISCMKKKMQNFIVLIILEVNVASNFVKSISNNNWLCYIL